MRIGRRLVLLLMLVFTLVPLLADHALAFSDVPAGDAYAPAIEDLSARGIINGFPDGTFGPDRAVTRQQFAKMVVLTFALPVTEGDVSLFDDVQIGGYADPYFPDNYIAVCAKYEITKGTTSNTFSPGDPIKRAQLITMVVRAVDRLDSDSLGAPPAGYSGSLPSFEDPTHSANLRKAEYNGLLAGLLGFGATWEPWGSTSRGEVAQVLHNVLLKIAEPPAGDTALVTRIVDGDTLHATYQGKDETIRLIGIDTPETGEPFSAEATAGLTALVAGRTVTVELDVDPRDQYGRLLAFLWLAGQLVNAEMLAQGLATLYTVPPDVKYVDELRAAEDSAKTNHRGIWGAATQSPLEVASVHADAAGNDNNNLNDEWIEFRVTVSGTLVGYAIEDATGHHYDFPDRVFTSGQVFKLHTGAGSNTQTDLYWGNGSAIWNNDGDTIKVLDSQGHVLVSQTY